MIPWVLLDSAPIPGNGGELELFQRGEELSIRIVGEGELMNSRRHSSEDAMAKLGCQMVSSCKKPRFLIGGLGMGYTLATVLQNVGEEAVVEVSELVPAVVRWNRGVIGELTAHPLQDSRVILHEVDVVKIIKDARNRFDAILLDVDNGPDGLTHQSNDWLYNLPGLKAAYAALRPGGVVAFWSAAPDPTFTRRLSRAGFSVREEQVRARGLKGTRNVIWFASRYGAK